MPTTLFEAKPLDPKQERRKRNLVIAVIVILVLGLVGLGAWWWWFQFWPEERAADHFFAAVKAGDMKKAYAVWMADPNWEQHPQQYARYPFGQFQNDWGTSGEWGIIKDYKVEGAASPPKTSYSTPSFVVVVVTVNGRVDKACLAVQKSDKSLGFSPYDEVRLLRIMKLTSEDYNCK